MKHGTGVSKINTAAEEIRSARVVRDVAARDVDVASLVDTIIIDRINTRPVRMDGAARTLCRTAGDGTSCHDDCSVVAADCAALSRRRFVLAVQNRRSRPHREHRAHFDVDYRVLIVVIGSHVRIADRSAIFKNHARYFLSVLRLKIKHILNLRIAGAVKRHIAHHKRSACFDLHAI